MLGKGGWVGLGQGERSWLSHRRSSGRPNSLLRVCVASIADATRVKQKFAIGYLSCDDQVSFFCQKKKKKFRFRRKSRGHVKAQDRRVAQNSTRSESTALTAHSQNCPFLGSDRTAAEHVVSRHTTGRTATICPASSEPSPLPSQ